MKDHTIVAGYGATGRGAVESLRANRTPADDIVVIDVLPGAVEEARGHGFTTVLGDATRTAVLRDAMVERAKSVIITCRGDDTATLVALTARELNPAASIVAAVREAENAHLLRESGADTVLISSEAAGRLIGLATWQPRAVDVLEDLIVAGRGLEMIERVASETEVGRTRPRRARAASGRHRSPGRTDRLRRRPLPLCPARRRGRQPYSAGAE